MTPRNEFEDEVIRFMSRIDEHMDNQNRRCDGHSKRIVELEDRTSDLEATRSYAKGVLKTLAVGIPAVASVTYFGFEIWKVVHR